MDGSCRIDLKPMQSGQRIRGKAISLTEDQNRKVFSGGLSIDSQPSADPKTNVHYKLFSCVVRF